MNTIMLKDELLTPLSDPVPRGLKKLFPIRESAGRQKAISYRLVHPKTIFKRTMKESIYLLALVPVLVLPALARAANLVAAQGGTPAITTFLEGGGLPNQTWAFQNDAATPIWVYWYGGPASFGGDSGDYPSLTTPNVSYKPASGGNAALPLPTWVNLAGNGTITFTFKLAPHLQETSNPRLSRWTLEVRRYRRPSI